MNMIVVLYLLIYFIINRQQQQNVVINLELPILKNGKIVTQPAHYLESI